MDRGEAAVLTIGLDLSDRFSSFCVLDGKGTVVEEGRLRTTTAALSGRFSAAPCRVILEVGTHSPWVSRLLAGLGHEVIVANPRRVRLIAEGQRKTDRTDAETLARLGRLDPALLSPVRHRGLEAQQALAVLRARDILVRTRTQLINHVRGAVKAAGGRLPSCSAPSFHRKALPYLPEEQRLALDSLGATIADLTARIEDYDREVERLAMASAAARALRQVPGVGALTALAFVLVIEDPERFRKSREVGPYLGLTPRQRQSGEREPRLPITKAGDALLRRLLVQCSHYILGPFGPDCDLRRWGFRIAGGAAGSHKRRAVIAVARKLAVLLHRLWITGEAYTPLRAGPGLAIAAVG